MGWNEVRGQPRALAGAQAWFYFVHSFYCVPADPSLIVGHRRLRQRVLRGRRARQRVRLSVSSGEEPGRRASPASALRGRCLWSSFRPSICSPARSCVCTRATTPRSRCTRTIPPGRPSAFRTLARGGCTWSISTARATASPAIAHVIEADPARRRPSSWCRSAAAFARARRPSLVSRRRHARGARHRRDQESRARAGAVRDASRGRGDGARRQGRHDRRRGLARGHRQARARGGARRSMPGARRPSCSPTSIATARARGPRSRPRRACSRAVQRHRDRLGRHRRARAPLARCAMRACGRRCAAARSTAARSRSTRPSASARGALRCSPSASSPASTSRPGASSRASTSWACATRAIRSSAPCATTPWAPTRSPSSTSRRPATQRRILLDVVERTAENIAAPLTVGGGVRNRDDVRDLLMAGADKVSINTAAVRNPDFVADVSAAYGAQAIVVAIDAKRVSAPGEPPRWEVFTHGGRTDEGLDVRRVGRIASSSSARARSCSPAWIATAPRTATTSALTRAVVERVSIPVIASGGVGTLEHVRAGLARGRRRRRAGRLDLPRRHLHRGGGEGLPSRLRRARASAHGSTARGQGARAQGDERSGGRHGRRAGPRAEAPQDHAACRDRHLRGAREPARSLLSSGAVACCRSATIASPTRASVRLDGASARRRRGRARALHRHADHPAGGCRARSHARADALGRGGPAAVGVWTLTQLRDDLEASLVPLNRNRLAPRAGSPGARGQARHERTSRAPGGSPTFRDLDCRAELAARRPPTSASAKTSPPPRAPADVHARARRRPSVDDIEEVDDAQRPASHLSSSSSQRAARHVVPARATCATLTTPSSHAARCAAPPACAGHVRSCASGRPRLPASATELARQGMWSGWAHRARAGARWASPSWCAPRRSKTPVGAPVPRHQGRRRARARRTTRPKAGDLVVHVSSPSARRCCASWAADR